MKIKSDKLGRNSLCPCGSGRKFKKCCASKAQEIGNFPIQFLKSELIRKYKIRFKTPEDINGIRKAGRLALDSLDVAESIIRPGITTEEINTVVHEFTAKNNAISAPLNYRGYPKSVCVSVNEVICHGIPGSRILRDGDIVNVDVTPILNGYYADANKTFFVGTPGPDAQRIVDITRECLRQGMSMIKPGNTTGHIGWAIQSYAESHGCSVVREFVGHGIGFEFHEPPQILHYGQKGDGFLLLPGMVFTIEPMINIGARFLRILEDKWTAVTNDGRLSAQFEQTILVTENGYESLTPFD